MSSVNFLDKFLDGARLSRSHGRPFKIQFNPEPSVDRGFADD
ncbi:hypothetical protein [Limnohabitans sp.]